MKWDRVAAWTSDVIAGDLSGIAATFAAHGAEAPTIEWDPGDEISMAPPLAFLLRHWRALASQHGIPSVKHIDPLDLVPALGYVIILEATDAGCDFNYRLYGSKIARISGFDMTGRLLSAFPSSTYSTEFAMATYRAVLISPRPLYTVRRPAIAEFTSSWQRLSLPLATDSGTLKRIIAATAAIDRHGNMIQGAF